MALSYSHHSSPLLSRRDATRTFIAYALIGFSNILLPAIIFSCSYLIIPFPRSSVLLIEGIPAVAAKLIFSHLIHYVPYWFRPIFVSLCWALCGVVTWATPPNIEPPVRVLIVMLATATAAVTDIWMLGMLRFYGKPGLSGWGVGTGAGYLASALYPYVVTVQLHMFLRSSLDYLSYPVAIAMASYYLVLPRGPRNTAIQADMPLKVRADESDDEADVLFLAQEPPKRLQNLQLRLEHNAGLMRSLFKPFMLSLCIALGAQTIALPGLTRAQPLSHSFDSFTAYAAAYGAALQLGNLLGRSSILLKRLENHRQVLLPLRILMCVFFVNTTVTLLSSSVIVFGVALLLGFFSGATWIQIMADALEQTSTNLTPADCEFSLGVIGAADSAGVLLGGLVGSMTTYIACSYGLGVAERWCYVAI